MAGPRESIKKENLKKIYKNLIDLVEWLSTVVPGVAELTKKAMGNGIDEFQVFKKKYDNELVQEKQGMKRNISDDHKYFVENIGKLFKSAKEENLDEVVSILENMQSITYDSMEECLLNSTVKNGSLKEKYSEGEYYLIISVATYITDLAKNNYEPLLPDKIEEVGVYAIHCNNLYIDEISKRTNRLDFFKDIFSSAKSIIESNAQKSGKTVDFMPAFMSSSEQAEAEFAKAIQNGSEQSVLDDFKKLIKDAHEKGLSEGLFDMLPKKDLGTAPKDVDLIKGYNEARELTKTNKTIAIPGTSTTLSEEDCKLIGSGLKKLLADNFSSEKEADVFFNNSLTDGIKAFDSFNAIYENEKENFSEAQKLFVENISKFINYATSGKLEQAVATLEEMRKITADDIDKSISKASVSTKCSFKEYQTIIGAAHYIEELAKNDFKPLPEIKLVEISNSVGKSSNVYYDQYSHNKHLLSLLGDLDCVLKSKIRDNSFYKRKKIDMPKDEVYSEESKAKFIKAIQNGSVVNVLEEFNTLVQDAINNDLSDGLLEKIQNEVLAIEYIKDEHVINKFNEIKDSLKTAEIKKEEEAAALRKVEEEKTAALKKAEEEKAAELKKQEETAEQRKAEEEAAKFKEQEEAAKLKEQEEAAEPEQEKEADEPEQEKEADELKNHEKTEAPQKQEEVVKPVEKQNVNPLDLRLHHFAKEAREELEAAKTIVNSDQYKALINCFKLIEKTNNINNDQCKEYLNNIGNLVDNYLNHKAQDGVKTNTYKKLAAVQRINEWLAKIPEEYNYKRELITQETVQKKLPEIGAVDRAKVLQKAQTQDKKITADTVRRVDDCICNIISKAEDGKMRTKLIEARNQLNQGVLPKAEKQNPVL